MNTHAAMRPDDVAHALLRANRPIFRENGLIGLGYYVEYRKLEGQHGAIYFNPFDSTFHHYVFDIDTGYPKFACTVPFELNWKRFRPLVAA